MTMLSAGQTHRPCLVLSLLLAVGIAIGYYWPVFLWVYVFLCLIALLLRHWPVAVICTGAIMMVLYMRIPPAPVGQVQGVIDSDVVHSNGGLRPAQVFTLRFAQGLAQAKYYGLEELHYGDQLRISGKWYRQAKRWQKYADHKGIFWQVSVPAKGSLEIIAHDCGNPVKALAIVVKNKIKSIVRKYLSTASAPTVIAILTGERGEMSKELKEVFLRSGTTHILAISGMNMAVIAAVFLFMLNLFYCPRQGKLIITIILLWFYTLLSGFSPPVVRACIMATIVLAAFLFDEGAEPLNSLGLAATLLLLMNPANLLNIGFQLSFAAVAGIFLGYAPLTQGMAFMPGWLAKSLAVSLAASLATAPISLWHFGSFAPVGILANIIVVPLADMVVLLGLCVSLAATVCPAVAPSIAGCLDAIFHIMVWSAFLFSRIPGGCWQI